MTLEFVTAVVAVAFVAGQITVVELSSHPKGWVGQAESDEGPEVGAGPPAESASLRY